jgi:predicted RNase H-like nuclease (RuvC/YqgF family)
MTNSSSTYIGIAAGAAIGAIISWWIYNRQNKTSLKQDHLLERINELEQKNRQILLKLESFAHHHEELLKKIFMINESILALDKKMQSMSKD